MSPIITVIIPSFKPDDYIDDCLTSLAVQSISKDSFEVIVILNGCDEPWKSRINSTLENLRTKHELNGLLLHTDIGNVSNARNIGITHSHGDYICFIDDDDLVSSTYLERLLAKVDENTVSLCHPLSFKDQINNILPSYSITDEYIRRKPYGHQQFWKARKFFQGPCMKMIHKDIIGNRRFDTRFKNGEDSIFMFLISDRIKWVDFTEEDAVYYRRIRTQSAHSATHNHKIRLKEAWNKMRMFTKYYFSAPFKYNAWFYITRILACFKTIINR